MGDLFRLIFFCILKGKYQKDFDLKVPTYWSKETQKYYKKMMEQKYTDWGVFNRSMNANNSSTKKIRELNEQFETWFDSVK